MNVELLCSAILEDISLGQILVSLTFIVGFITTINKSKTIVDDWFKNKLSPKVDPLYKRLDDFAEKLNELEMDSYKRYLVLTMTNIERGEKIDEVERLLFDEMYKKYIDHGGNTYIQRKYKKLEEAGKL